MTGFGMILILAQMLHGILNSDLAAKCYSLTKFITLVDTEAVELVTATRLTSCIKL